MIVTTHLIDRALELLLVPESDEDFMMVNLLDGKTVRLKFLEADKALELAHGGKIIRALVKLA